MKILVLILTLCISIFSADFFKVDNGQIKIYEVLNDGKYFIKLGKKKINFISHPRMDNKQIAFIPIRYKEKRKIIKAKLFKNGKLYENINVYVTKGKYKKEYLQVKKSKVNPKKTLPRISKEYHEAMKIYGTYSKKRLWNGDFISPLNSKITSPYGVARLFNKSLKSYHSGTDFRAKIGTPIIASNDGEIVLVKNRYYAGNSVIISHGEGIYTGYYHLSKFKVKVGQKVKKGDIIGLSGKTGRITGPHLHFNMYVNGVGTDPLQFLEKVNSL